MLTDVAIAVCGSIVFEAANLPNVSVKQSSDPCKADLNLV